MTTTTAESSQSLQHTPFHQYHLNHGGKMVPFAGWEMPIRYGSIIQEHHQVRNSGGMFDVSHMGRLRFKGKDARAFLDHICTRQVWGMKDSMVRYSMICNENGGCRDDVLVYKIADSEYYMVCNASNRLKLLDHFENVRSDFTFKLKDETESTGMIALQGPNIIELLSEFSSSIPELKRYRFIEKNLIIAKVMISRTGYTGEDGVEVIMPKSFANKAIDMMLAKMPEQDTVKPCGLGARDSLRLEAGMALYGHEIEEHLDPVSAQLGFAMKLNKSEDPENSPPEVGRFIGQDALQQITKDGPKQKLIGLALAGKRAARQGMKIMKDGNEVGFITSGCWSPTLEKSIAMGYIDSALAEAGNIVSIDPEKLKAPAQVCAIPFYKAG